MDAPRLQYRLPMTCVRISGKLSVKTDKVLNRLELVRQGTCEIVVAADPRGPLQVQLDGGSLRDTQATFALTEDGRLTSSNSTVTGRGAEIVSGVVGVATTLASIAAKAAPALLAVREMDVVPRFDYGQLERAAASPEDEVDKAYERANGDAARARKSARENVRALTRAQNDGLEAIAKATSPAQLNRETKRLTHLSLALSTAKQARDEADALFKAWRAGTQEQKDVELIYDITMDELRMSDVSVEDGVVKFRDPDDSASGKYKDRIRAAQAKVAAAWHHLGCLVVIQDDPEDKEEPGSIPPRDEMVITIRHPRPVRLAFYRADDEGKALVVAIRPAMIVDGLSFTERIHIGSGLFGKRGRGITFSPQGLPTGYDFSTSSETAGAVGAFAGVPGNIATSLENANKIADQWNSLREKDREQQASRLKRELEMKQNELTLAGLDATDDDYAEAKRLEQQVSMLEYQTKLTPAPPAVPDATATEIARLRQQVELQWLRRTLDHLAGD